MTLKSKNGPRLSQLLSDLYPIPSEREAMEGIAEIYLETEADRAEFLEWQARTGEGDMNRVGAKMVSIWNKGMDPDLTVDY